MSAPISHAPVSITRRVVRRVGIVFGTLIVIGLSAGAVIGLSDIIAVRASAVPAPEPAPSLAVPTLILQERAGYVVQRRFPGQVEAAQSAALSFETGGTIAMVGVDEGSDVTKGQVIARLDTRLLEAERKRLQASREAITAQAELARRTSERQEALLDRGFASRQALDEASLGLVELTARTAEIDAALASVAVQLDKAVLRAPFSGRVATRFVDEGVAIGGGAPVLSLLEEAAPQFRVGIDPALDEAIASSPALDVTIGEAVYAARLSALRPDLDPGSRTRTALLTLPDAARVYGQTGLLSLSQTIDARGFEIPVAALREGIRGLWTVLTLEESEDGLFAVGLEAVTVIQADERSAFVQGTLQDGMRIVAGGTHRVAPGQRVRLLGEAE